MACASYLLVSRNHRRLMRFSRRSHMAGAPYSPQLPRPSCCACLHRWAGQSMLRCAMALDHSSLRIVDAEQG
jgi:hypothetical protein